MSRERLKYYSVFVGLVWLVAPLAAYHNKNPAALAICVPTGLGWAFQYDMAYGNLMVRA